MPISKQDITEWRKVVISYPLSLNLEMQVEASDNPSCYHSLDVYQISKQILETIIFAKN